MKLKDLLAKLLAKGFATKSEQEEVNTAEAAATDAEKEEVKEDLEEVRDLPEDEEGADGIDEENLKNLVSGEVAKAAKSAIEKELDAIAQATVDKFMAGVKSKRKVATATATAPALGKFEETKNFFKMVFTEDKASLKAAGYLDTATAGTAGYLVPPAEFIAEVYRIAETGYGIARQEMRYISKVGPGNKLVVPALGTSVDTFWTGEGVAKTSTEPTFNLPEVILKKLAAIVPWTDEFEEDMGVDAIQLLAELFAEALAKKEDIAFFKGDGTSTYGSFTGILNNGDVNEVVMDGVASIEDMTADDLLAMIDATPSGALAGAKFYMNRTILSIVRKLKTEDGVYIYQQPGGAMPATIWNYPVQLVEAMPGAADDAEETGFVIFGNLRNTCIVSDKGTLSLKVFDSGVVRNVTNNADLNLITQDMKALRVVRRTGFTIALPKGLTVLKTDAES